MFQKIQQPQFVEVEGWVIYFHDFSIGDFPKEKKMVNHPLFQRKYSVYVIAIKFVFWTKKLRISSVYLQGG